MPTDQLEQEAVQITNEHALDLVHDVREYLGVFDKQHTNQNSTYYPRLAQAKTALTEACTVLEAALPNKAKNNLETLLAENTNQLFTALQTSFVDFEKKEPAITLPDGMGNELGVLANSFPRNREHYKILHNSFDSKMVETFRAENLLDSTNDGYDTSKTTYHTITRTIAAWHILRSYSLAHEKLLRLNKPEAEERSHDQLPTDVTAMYESLRLYNGVYTRQSIQKLSAFVEQRKSGKDDLFQVLVNAQDFLQREGSESNPAIAKIQAFYNNETKGYLAQHQDKLAIAIRAARLLDQVEQRHLNQPEPKQDRQRLSPRSSVPAAPQGSDSNEGDYDEAQQPKEPLVRAAKPTQQDTEIQKLAGQLKALVSDHTTAIIDLPWSTPLAKTTTPQGEREEASPEEAPTPQQSIEELCNQLDTRLNPVDLKPNINWSEYCAKVKKGWRMGQTGRTVSKKDGKAPQKGKSGFFIAFFVLAFVVGFVLPLAGIPALAGILAAGLVPSLFAAPPLLFALANAALFFGVALLARGVDYLVSLAIFTVKFARGGDQGMALEKLPNSFLYPFLPSKSVAKFLEAFVSKHPLATFIITSCTLIFLGALATTLLPAISLTIMTASLIPLTLLPVVAASSTLAIAVINGLALVVIIGGPLALFAWAVSPKSNSAEAGAEDLAIFDKPKDDRAGCLSCLRSIGIGSFISSFAGGKKAVAPESNETATATATATAT